MQHTWHVRWKKWGKSLTTKGTSGSNMSCRCLSFCFIDAADSGESRPSPPLHVWLLTTGGKCLRGNRIWSHGVLLHVHFDSMTTISSQQLLYDRLFFTWCGDMRARRMSVHDIIHRRQRHTVAVSQFRSASSEGLGLCGLWRRVLQRPC